MARFIVLGDSHTEHVIAPLGRRSDRPEDLGSRAVERNQTHCFFKVAGGAALLRIAMRTAAAKLPPGVLVSAHDSKTSTDAADPELLVEFESFLPKGEAVERWRMRRVLGWSDISARPLSKLKSSPIKPARLSDVIVVYDRADAPRKGVLEYFARIRNAGKPAVAIIQCRQPKAKTSLVTALAEDMGNTTQPGRLHVVAVVHANSLRDAWEEPAPGISTLSCERGALRILKAFTQVDGVGTGSPESATHLSHVFRGVNDVIVVSSASALVWCRRRADVWSASLIYHTSGVYESRQAIEDRLGLAGLVTISIGTAFATRGFPSSQESVDKRIERGARTAIVRCRHYQEKGLRILGTTDRKDRSTAATSWCMDLVASLTKSQTKDLNDKVTCEEILEAAEWTLLRSCCRGAVVSKRKSSQHGADRIAETIVHEGIEAAEIKYKLPIARFGEWVGVDTEEIEGYQSLRRLMAKYVTQPAWKRPLSLAAFGPPGSGKSWGIRQVASSLRTGQPGSVGETPLEFNFGSFTSTDDLHRALHVVRDATLRGEVPLVMFDEFDSTFDGRPHGWLRYLLAPTQDGTFRDGGLVFHVGRAIFVFVGGISPTFDDLAGQVHRRTFVEAKGPDFVSRLRGHVNVRGPDRIGERDEFFVIRRAVILRDLLERQFGRDRVRTGTVKLHSQIVKAFLGVREYRHGVRSMEAIVEMSDFVDPRNQFAESALPLRDQLEMHTDAFDFFALVRNEPRKRS